MSHLVQLREQIKAVQTTKKITHAVRLVSMSMYAKLEKFASPHQTYFESITDFFAALLDRSSEWQNSTFNSEDLFDLRPLVVVVSTAKGLCGSLNSNLFRFLEQNIIVQPDQIIDFIVIGQKGIRFIKEASWGEIVYAYSELNSNNYLTLSEDIVDRILNSSKKYTSVTFFSSYLHSFFHQQPRKVKILPIQKENLNFFSTNDDLKKGSVFFAEDPIFEQQLDEMLEYTAASYFYGFVLNVLFQSILAEHAARFLAMDSSTTNAEKYLEKLTLQYNKIRQAVITKEVAELSSNTFIE